MEVYFADYGSDSYRLLSGPGDLAGLVGRLRIVPGPPHADGARVDPWARWAAPLGHAVLRGCEVRPS